MGKVAREETLEAIASDVSGVNQEETQQRIAKALETMADKVASQFIAKYGETTFSEIKSKYESGCAVVCKMTDESGNTRILPLGFITDTGATFNLAEAEGTDYAAITYASVGNDNVWETQTNALKLSSEHDVFVGILGTVTYNEIETARSNGQEILIKETTAAQRYYRYCDWNSNSQKSYFCFQSIIVTGNESIAMLYLYADDTYETKTIPIPTKTSDLTNDSGYTNDYNELQNKPKTYEHIEDITITESMQSFERTAEPDGTPYSFRSLLLLFYSPGSNGSHGSKLHFYSTDDGTYTDRYTLGLSFTTNTMNRTVGIGEVLQPGLQMPFLTSSTSLNTSAGTLSMGNNAMPTRPITKFELIDPTVPDLGVLTSGDTITIYGIRW